MSLSNKLLYLTTAFIMSFTIEHAVCMDPPQGGEDVDNNRNHRHVPEGISVFDSMTNDHMHYMNNEKINRILNSYRQSLRQLSAGDDNTAAGLSLPAGEAVELEAGISHYHFPPSQPGSEREAPFRFVPGAEISWPRYYPQEMEQLGRRDRDEQTRTTFLSTSTGRTVYTNDGAAYALEEPVYSHQMSGYFWFSENPFGSTHDVLLREEPSSPTEETAFNFPEDLQKDHRDALAILRPALKGIDKSGLWSRSESSKLNDYLIKIVKKFPLENSQDIAKRLLPIIENIKDIGLKGFLELAANLSCDELEQLMEVGFVFHKGRISHQWRFTEKLIELPKNECFSIINCFAKIFTRLPNLRVKKAIIILNAFQKLTPAQRQNVTNFCLDELPAELFNNTELLALYIKTINHLPEGKYHQILKEVYPFLKKVGIPPEHYERNTIEKEFCRLLDLLIKMPSSERKDVLEKTSQLSVSATFKEPSINSNLSLTDVVTLISQIPFNQRTEVIHYANQFYKGVEHRHAINAINAVKDALANGKKYLLDIALDFDQKIGWDNDSFRLISYDRHLNGEKNYCYNLISILNPLPETELRLMTQNADLQSLLKYSNYRRAKEALSFFVKLSVKEQTDILPYINEIFYKLHSNTPLTPLFNKLLDIPSSERPRIVKLILPLLCCKINCDDTANLGGSFLFEYEEAVQLELDFAPVLSLDRVIAVIEELVPLTQSERSSVCSYLNLFLASLNKENTKTIKDMANAIMALPEMDRDDIIRTTIKLHKAKTPFAYLSTLKSLASLSSKGRRLLTKYAPHLKISEKHMDNYIECLAKLSFEEQEILHAQALTLYEKTQTNLEHTWGEMLEVLAKLTVKERYIVLQHPSLQKWINEDNLLSILKTLANKKILGFASCSEMLEILTDLQQINPIRYIIDPVPLLERYLLQLDSPWRAKVFDHWTRQLSSPDERQVRELSNLILENINNFHLHQEHPIVQEALRVRILLADRRHSLNPYSFYKALKAKREEPVDLNQIQLPEEIMEGQRVQLNPVYLQTLGQNAYATGVPLETLPPYSATFFQDMRKQIEDRLQTHPQLNAKIQSMFESSFAELTAGALGSSFLPSLLHVDESQNRIVSLLSAKLIALVTKVESAPTEIPEDNFSEKERKFLELIYSITACTTGKSEAIHLLYNHLEKQDQLIKEDSSLLACGDVQRYVNDVLRSEVEKVFSGNGNFIRNLLKLNRRNPIEQEPHQQLYAKNLIGHEVGLMHHFTFDTHSQVLSQNLVERTKMDVLQIFYNHFPATHFINQIQQSLNKAIAIRDGRITWQMLQEILKDEDQTQLWDIDMASGMITIREAGTIDLLKKLGVLK
ncbi:hypothetical protein [Candidatus Paracaedibacter symbiosus]|uniref:hypothetical protein n=1 Tax=Candidatus Paracaedibacter symbiosus TaxID=244582 RepID=UPI00050956C5|nr:hypothetical protein [Candidatus Paracaedibacter symbiosus]